MFDGLNLPNLLNCTRSYVRAHFAMWRGFNSHRPRAEALTPIPVNTTKIRPQVVPVPSVVPQDLNAVIDRLVRDAPFRRFMVHEVLKDLDPSRLKGQVLVLSSPNKVNDIMHLVSRTTPTSVALALTMPPKKDWMAC